MGSDPKETALCICELETRRSQEIGGRYVYGARTRTVAVNPRKRSSPFGSWSEALCNVIASHWSLSTTPIRPLLANLALNDLDHALDRGAGFITYVRYLDDMVVLAPDSERG